MEQQQQRLIPSSSSSSSSSAAALEDCLKLLRGERDEQRLAGLLLVTKLCNKDDLHSLRQVYHSLAPHFLTRLLRTGLGSGSGPGGENDNRDGYLQLCVPVLAAFCRVPEIAASPDMLSKIPTILQIMEMNESASSVMEDCYEILYLMSTHSDDAVTSLFESGGLNLLAKQLPSLPEGSQILELSLRIVQLVVSKVPLDAVITRHLAELSVMVPFISRQFAVSQNALKFDLLQLLCVVLSSDRSGPLHKALRAKSKDTWPAYLRAGVVDILQNRVAPDQKLQALIVAESVVSILGEQWLIDQMDVPDLHQSTPSDRCLLLVLECTRVEIAVLLNELAYMKYEASSSITEALPSKKRNLAIAYSLVERIIKLISNASEEEEEGVIAFSKIIYGLDETIGLVLEYLKDAKDHQQKKGDDLLASVRVAGSYLAEAPLACREKVKELLNYLLSVEGEEESRPFLSICFMLPMLCQFTMQIEGVKVLASSGSYKAVVECLVRLIDQDPHLVEDNGCIFLACDTILNFLLKREHIKVSLDASAFVCLLKALALWADGTGDRSIVMMASAMCSLIFESMSEEALLQHPDIDLDIICRLSQLIARSIQKMSNDENSEVDLHQIIASGYSRWAARFPHVRQAVER